MTYILINMYRNFMQFYVPWQTIYVVINLRERRFVMTITDIKIRKIISDGKLKAIVSVTLDNLIAIHDIKVIEGTERLFVAMPSRREDNGTFRDIVHPISAEGRRIFDTEVLDAYHKVLEEEQNRSNMAKDVEQVAVAEQINE